MQKDFHYGVIKILALSSGFNENESEIIAYSSQYVDDAVMHRPFLINGNLPFAHPRHDGKYFDPVCTAHRGIQLIEDFKRSVQNKIYLSFHFLPSTPYKGKKRYDYLVRPNSEMAQVLIYWAISKLKTNYNLENLIRLGVALHTFADAWAHQGFTGTHDHLYNDIKHIEIWNGHHWEAIKPYKQFLYNFLPDIGHAEAYDFPDLPHLKWRYTRAKTNELILRDNTSIFLEAAEEIFKILCSLKDCSIDWKLLEPKLQRCLSLPHNKKDIFSSLKKYFPKVKFIYNRNLWLNQAIHLKKLKNFPKIIGEVKGDKKWFLFHKVAYEQRYFVLNKIKTQ